MTAPDIKPCPCKCHESDSVYAKGASGHCWVCESGKLTIAPTDPHSDGKPHPDFYKQIGRDSDKVDRTEPPTEAEPHSPSRCSFFACNVGGSRCPYVANPKYRPTEAVTADGLGEILGDTWHRFKDVDEAHAAIEAYYNAKFERALGETYESQGVRPDAETDAHDAAILEAQARWYKGRT